MRRDERNTDRMAVGGQAMRQRDEGNKVIGRMFFGSAVEFMSYLIPGVFFLLLFIMVLVLKHFSLYIFSFCPLEGEYEVLSLIFYLLLIEY